MRPCRVVFLGRIGYEAATALQGALSRDLKEGRGPEHLLLLEHPPVITLGRNAREADVLAGGEDLRRLAVEVARTDRGGQVTYHGPGQLVGYPILDLRPDRRDVARFLRDIEEVLIRVLARFGIAAGRHAGLTGVWAGDRKIAAIGVHLSRWVTTHGFALNVSTDLSHFGLIVPCGLREAGVTSMARLLGRAPSIEGVAQAIVPEFGRVFGREMIPAGGAAASAAAGPPAGPAGREAVQ